MAKKVPSNKPAQGSKKGSAKSTKRTAAQIVAEVESILDEMRDTVLAGMSPKEFSSDSVEASLREVMRPKVRRRLVEQKGNWEKEKGNVLICADHMGQIAKVLAKGEVVDLSVADAARIAVKSDEHCKRGAAGGGDWCF